MRGTGLCVRLGVGAAQYGDCPAGRGRPDDILPAERPYSAGNRVSHKPLWSTEIGLLAAWQGAGFSVLTTRYNLQMNIKIIDDISNSSIKSGSFYIEIFVACMLSVLNLRRHIEEDV